MLFFRRYIPYQIGLQNTFLRFLQMDSKDVSDSKRPCLLIGTHDGNFHCDEVLACFLLKLLPQYKNANIIRSRNQEKLDTCDIVVDVGGVYDPSKHRYDHHQRTFKESFNSLDPKKKWTTKLSSAGLVYFHFGRSIIKEILKHKASDDITELLYDKMYEKFVEEVDGVDNGISAFDGKPRYITTSTLSSRVKHLNPSWNDATQDYDVGFYKAMDLVGVEFLDRLDFFHTSWLPARDLVMEAVNNRFTVHSSGEIMKLERGGCPWRDHLFKIEEELSIEPTIKHVLFTDQSGNWRVMGVPIEETSFELKVPLHEDWRGLRDEELSTKSGIPDCIFCHTSGFIGGNKTYDGTLRMATESLKHFADK